MKNKATRWLSALLIGASALLVLIIMMVSGLKRDPAKGSPTPISVQKAPASLIAAPSSQANAAPVYRHSVIPGGVRQASALTSALAHDQYARAHFSNFNAARAYIVHAKAPRMVHVSYRMGEKIYWTKKKVRLPAGEALLTDGKSFVRARCGNRISDAAQANVSDKEPAPEALDTVIAPPGPELDGARQSSSTVGRRNGPMSGPLNNEGIVAPATATPRAGSPGTGAPGGGGLPPLSGTPMPGAVVPPAVEPKPGVPPSTVEPKPGPVPPPIEAPTPVAVPPPVETPIPGTVPPPTESPPPGTFPPPTEGPTPGAFPPPVTGLPPPFTPPLPPITVPEKPPTEVPEPATFALVVLALIGLISVQQRRRPKGKREAHESGEEK